MHLPTIRPMTPADVEPIAAAFLREAWGDRRVTLEFVSRHPQARPFVADADGPIVGTGVASLNGSAAWIGTVWVDPAWRRRGLGMALTQATIDAAEAAGCRTLILVATDAGRRLYERIGFEVETHYRILEAPGLGRRPVDPRIRPWQAADLPAMVRLSAAATGEDRGHLLEAFARPSTASCLIRADGSLGGFVVRAPWGGGQTIAPEVADAVAILDARRIGRPMTERLRAGLLAENDAGLARLRADGWQEAWQAPRLIRGDPLAWRPESIWGQFNFALG